MIDIEKGQDRSRELKLNVGSNWRSLLASDFRFAWRRLASLRRRRGWISHWTLPARELSINLTRFDV